ncbi:Uncharacterised protein [Vibrio cholerae]|nr:Uncharacterised protein [Vibrio cholerae]
MSSIAASKSPPHYLPRTHYLLNFKAVVMTISRIFAKRSFLGLPKSNWPPA